MRKTRIIALEGIDGSGKTVQVEALSKYLSDSGHSVAVKSFPVYESFFGKTIGMLLKGDVIAAADVDQKSMCLWYALDRWANFKDYEDGTSDYLVINRYVLSNAAYQSARDRDKGLPGIWEWVKELEFVTLGLPEPDVHIVLDVAPEEASGNIDKKGYREYVGNEKDSYEAQEGLQARVRAKYRQIGESEKKVAIIDCMQGDAQKKPEVIAGFIVEELKKRCLL